MEANAAHRPSDKNKLALRYIIFGTDVSGFIQPCIWCSSPTLYLFDSYTWNCLQWYKGI